MGFDGAEGADEGGETGFRGGVEGYGEEWELGGYGGYVEDCVAG